MKRLRTATLAALAVGALAACTPQEVGLYLAVTQGARDGATAGGFTPEVMAQVRYCESGSNYQRLEGPFHGAYSFRQEVWDSVASRHFIWLVGQAAENVEWYWQDAMAQALWSDAGSAPWRECYGPATWCASFGCQPTAARDES